MKKFLTLIMTLCFATCAVFALTACGSEDVDVSGKTFAYDHVEILTTGLTEEQQAIIEESVAAEGIDKVQVSFKADKTYQVALDLIWAQNPVQTGKWKVNGNQVVLMPDDDYPDQTYIYSEGKFYGNKTVPYGEEEDEVAACRLWFTEVK